MSGGDGSSSGSGPVLTVHIQDSELSLDVRSLTIEDNDRLIDKAVIEVLDRPRVCTDFVAEGQTVKIDLGWPDERAVLFEGVVQRVRGESNPGARRVVTITAYDLSYHLMLGDPKTRDHVGKLSDILNAIASEYSGNGIAIGQIEPDPDPEFTAQAPLRQVNKKDWQFIQDLTLAYGGRAFVEYNDDTSKFYYISESRLVGGDAMGSLRLCRGYSHLQEFSFERVAARAAMQRTAVTVDPRTGEVSASEQPPPAPPDTPAAPDADHAARLADQAGSSAANRYNAAAEIGASATSTPADQRPRTRAAGLPSAPSRLVHLTRVDPTQELGLRGRGLANGTIWLRAKGKVSLMGVATWADGEWYVRKAEHQYRRAGSNATYKTRFLATR